MYRKHPRRYLKLKYRKHPRGHYDLKSKIYRNLTPGKALEIEVEYHKKDMI